MKERFAIVGKRLPRKDALAKAKGEIKFASDIFLPGMLYAGFLRSPYAHARIKSIDTSRADALPGVKKIISYKSTALKGGQTLGQIRVPRKFECLLNETVRYAGEVVAVVAAVDAQTAEEALGLIEVQYEVLPAVFDKMEGCRPDAPRIYPDMDSNLYCCPRTVNGVLPLEFGDVEEGFARADHIIEGIYDSPMQHPVSPEPLSVVCEWTGDNLTCWTSSQRPQGTREDIAISLGLPFSSVRVIATNTVGGYGAKSPEKMAALVALLAKATGKPVRALFSRAEDFVGTHRRIDARVEARVGVKDDGTITALHTKLYTNFGRDSRLSYYIPATAAVDTCSTLYKYETSKFEGYHVITNTEDHGAMNGFGDPESGFGIERLMDEAAERIGMDPVDFRLKNCMRYGDKGMEFFPAMVGPVEWGVVGPDLDSFPECIRLSAEKAGWKAKWKGWRIPVAVNGSRRKGIGIAIGMHHCIATTPDSGSVKMNKDGTVDAFSSDPEIGQGLKTAVAQVVAEELGVAYESVNVVLSDTSITPYGGGVFGSRGTLAGVGSVHRAAQEAKRKLLELAAKKLGASPEELAARDGLVYVKADPRRSISIAALCTEAYQIVGNAVLPYPWTDERSGKNIVPVSVAVAIAEVEVDTETGLLEVERITSAHDCGRVLNPTIVENQINLSITMGNGYVRSEEIVIDKTTGAILNPNLLDYKVMTILDMPKSENVSEIMVEFPCPWGPFGAKGMSETATTTQAPAIANAIYNATGVRIRGAFLTADRLLEALARK
ncbi:MAG: xanthine dehydrogenase family protein molybdopterin-binding subunit [Chloroflexi bacterium]|nr:xanthine dehydrogenase family protein molybdopterin-binding subunit [Chloroflexota bacterium]